MAETSTAHTDAPQPADPPTGGTARQGRLLVALVVIGALVALFWPQGSPDRRVPEGTLVDGAGQPVTLAERLAPVTLVHFWSTWCLPCLDEVPVLMRLAAAREPSGSFAVVMVAVSDDRQAVSEFLTPYPGRELHDAEWNLAKAFGTDKLPETHLVVDGLVVHTFVGITDWASPQVAAEIDAQVATARAASTTAG